MPHNDQLTKTERLRLESLAQAINMVGHVSEKRPTAKQIFDLARDIEQFLAASNPN